MKKHAKIDFSIGKHPKKRKIEISKIVDTSGPKKLFLIKNKNNLKIIKIWGPRGPGE